MVLVYMRRDGRFACGSEDAAKPALLSKTIMVPLLPTKPRSGTYTLHVYECIATDFIQYGTLPEFKTAPQQYQENINYTLVVLL
jgi:hypothetical protein